MAAEHAHESEDDDERFDDVHAVRLGLPLSRGAGAGRKTLLATSPTLFLGAFLRQFMLATGIRAQNKTFDPPIDPFFRSAASLEPFHHAGTALEHGYTRIDTWPRLRNADKAWRDISSYCPRTHAARLPARVVAATARETHNPVDREALRGRPG